MKKLFISFLFFVSLSNIISLTQTTVDLGYPVKLDNSHYFFIYNSSYSSKIYFYLKDQTYGLYHNKLKLCYTNIYPTYDNTFLNCGKQSSFRFTNAITQPGITQYFYSFDINSDYQYYTIYYNGALPYSGKLYAEASKSSLYNKINKEINGEDTDSGNDEDTNSDNDEGTDSGLSAGFISLIVIVSIFCLGVIILIILFICLTQRKKTIYGAIGDTQPLPTAVIANPSPISDPLTAQYTPCPENQMYQAPCIA